MGLLDKAEEIKKTSEGKVSQAPSAKKETPSLLKKAEHFREVEPPIPATKKESLSIPDSDSEWLDDAISDSLATEIGDLPSPDGEEEFDLSDIPELTDSDFGDLSEEHERWDEDPVSNLEDDLDSLHEESNPYEPVSSDLESDLTPDQESENESVFPEPDAIESEIEENTIVEDENPEVKPEPVQNKDKEPELGDDLIERDYHDDLVEPDVPLPEVNLFDEWENDAKKEAAKQPLRPVKEDPAPIGEEVLFDDESDFSIAPMAYHLASKKESKITKPYLKSRKKLLLPKSFLIFLII